MAALRNFFRRPSSVLSQTTTDDNDGEQMPDRIDAVWIDWRRSHVHVKSGSMVDGQTYNYDTTSLRKIRTSSVSRAVYCCTQLRRLRAMCRLLEMELQIQRDAWMSTGIMYDPEVVPSQTANFVRTDVGINKEIKFEDRFSGIPHPDIFMAAAGLIGLIAIVDPIAS